jgi:hypothetical protein
VFDITLQCGKDHLQMKLPIVPRIDDFIQVSRGLIYKVKSIHLQGNFYGAVVIVEPVLMNDYDQIWTNS